MWHQMDNSVMGGLMGRMFHGARAMKSMFSDLLPGGTAGSSSMHNSNSMLDFLPTETTRVKYIIRNPHTNKPMKIIKMRGSTKKIVKLVNPIAKPLPNKMSFDTRMRQVEKEQELIAEGKLPASSDEAIMEKYFQHKLRGNNEVVSGKIMEYQSWKPVYRPGEQPSAFITQRPQPLTQLHTDIVASGHELLPKPEKLVASQGGDDEIDADDVHLQNALGRHTYEVTEHTGEESGEVHVHIPITAFGPMESGFVPSKHQYRARNGSTTTSTTTEAPNYPAAYLKKYREREREHSQATKHGKRHKQHQQHQHKEVIIIHTDSEPWLPTPTPSSASNSNHSMSSLRARLQEQQRKDAHQQKDKHQSDEEMEATLVDAMQGDKWPAEVKHTYLSIGPSAVAYMQPDETEQQPLHYRLPKSEYKRQHSNLRQRGSIKFGDKPVYDEM
ncbi:uncharacterized protein LOC115634431 [Scaptodrosophila lebanonensis]|uniref:Uncharacterized protein LOC115634431 n=1 Tax=Drosophila lebanonensis TaxID=7225 RepID=A0A6J2UKK3_DROLE|nr:uncharacterized protein LOC115634431 [Scaptodrosophila lebanonensis]